MIERKITVTGIAELTTEKTMFFVQKAVSFKSDIKLLHDGKTINAKSLLGMLVIGIKRGSEVTIIADGTDEESAVEALSIIL